MYSYITYFCLR